MVSDELWDKLYDAVSNAVYYELTIYFKDNPARNMILGEAASAILSNVIEVLEEDARRSS